MITRRNENVGSFIIRNDGDGCLTIKYHNVDNSQGPYVECCKIDSKSTSTGFEGTYFTTWIEERNTLTSMHGKLKIDRNGLIYSLIWSDTENQEIFNGSGFILMANI